MDKDHLNSERKNLMLPRFRQKKFQLEARDLLYAASQRQKNACHSLCYPSFGELPEMGGGGGGGVESLMGE